MSELSTIEAAPRARRVKLRTYVRSRKRRVVFSWDYSLAAFRPQNRVYIAVKTGLEWTIAAMLLVLSSPLILVLALLVKKTSDGPAFYSQTRLGLRGRPYRIYKLRTMTHNCEAATGAVWATQNDNRITPIGRLLRDTHLDELPQLWNVLRGDMSLIGPRPERPEIARRLDAAIPNYRARMLVRPGLTGLAQMRLPPDYDLNGVKHKVAHDLYYVRELCLTLDIRIGLSTACYFLATAAQAICEFLVEPYGRIVEAKLSQENMDGEKEESFPDAGQG